MKTSDFYNNKAFAEAQLWVFNGFSAVSLAFYFALFSAGNPENFSVLLQLTIVLFGISLATNAPLALLIMVSDKDIEFLNMLNNSKFFGWIPIIATYSTMFAVLSLIAFYSCLAFIVVIATVCAIVYLFNQALKAEKIKHKEKMRELKAERISLTLDILKQKKERDSEKE